MLSDALTLPETPPAVKIARLMVVSDLLHNTGAGLHHRLPALPQLVWLWDNIS